jgi:sec-independent protein translocase protein TatB
MLDVGFSEILLTSAIALIVLGPERLPKVARQVGNWMGRARAMARQLTEQLEREVSAEELLKEQKKTPRPNITGAPSAPAAFDTSYSPNPPAEPAPTVAAPAQVVEPSASAQPATAGSAAAGSAAPSAASPSGTYSSAATPHGADWQPAPTDSHPGNG